MPKLVITDGDGVRDFPLTGEAKAGRLGENAIQLKVAEASRQHCRFFEDKGSWFVEDLGSSNGTLVNGRKVSKFELQDGDVIAVGAATMKFLDVEAAPAAPAVEGWGDDDEISLEQETFLLLGLKGREGEVVKLAGERLSVGRTKKNLLALADASVSGEHAEIVRRGDAWFVRDLMSSNGTFVEGEKVKERELKSGQTVRFGLVDARFCIGKAKDFSPPTAAAEDDGASEADTAPMTLGDAGGALDDAAFAVHAGAPKAGGGLGSLVAVVLLLAIGGGAVFYYLNAQGQEGDGRGTAKNGRHTPSNVVPEAWWSFEAVSAETAAAGGWRKDDPLDPAAVDDGAGDARTGDACLAVSRGAEGGAPTYVTLVAGVDTEFSAAGGAWYRVSAAVRTETGATGGPFVAWYGPPGEGETEPRLLSRDVVPAPLGDGWTEAVGVVQAPDGAAKARIGVAAAGGGTAWFDDVALESADGAGAGFEIRNFKAVATPSGSLRLSRFARSVVDAAGYFRRGAAGAEHGLPWTAWRPRAGGAAGRAAGSLDGRIDAAFVLEKKGDAGFTATWTLSAAAPDHVFALALPATPQDLSVTAFDGDRAARLRGPFADVPATAVIVGDRGDRARFSFVDGDGKPVAVKLSAVARAGRALLVVDRGGATSVGVEAQLSFDAEQKQAQELLTKASEALRSGRDGEALALFETTLARFSFDEAIEKDAAQRRERAVADAQKRLRELTTRVEDALFFRTARRDEALAKDLADEAARFALPEGAPTAGPGAAVAALRDKFETERAKDAAARAETEAKLAFLRGQDYMANASRAATAAAFFESVARRFPGTEWGKQAAALVQKLQSK